MGARYFIITVITLISTIIIITTIVIITTIAVIICIITIITPDPSFFELPRTEDHAVGAHGGLRGRPAGPGEQGDIIYDYTALLKIIYDTYNTGRYNIR